MPEQDYNTTVQKTLNEYAKLLGKAECKIIEEKHITTSCIGFINSLKACHTDFNETYYICILENQKNLIFSATLIENDSRIIQTSKCDFITCEKPPPIIKAKEKCGFKKITSDYTCFIADDDPLTYIVLPDTHNRLYFLTAEIISSVSLPFSRIVREFQRTRNALTRKQKDYEDFVHYVSHGLKSPLTSILGFSNLLKNSINSLNKEEINLYGEKILNKSKQINRMLEELVYLSRIKPELKRTDALKTLKSILEKLSKDLQDKKIEIKLLNKLPQVLISGDHLAKVFESILQNCIEFCPSRSKVTINFKNGEIIISDNGPGIPETLLKKVGQPFISTKTKSTSLSSGMGLFIARKIIETYGGAFRIESRYGYGTTVFIRLPASENQGINTYYLV